MSSSTSAASASASANAVIAAAAAASEVQEFAESALFVWVQSCLPAHDHEPPLAGYSALLDAFVLHRIWLQIDPEPQHHPSRLDGCDELHLPNARARNFDAIIKNLKCLFEEELDQTVLVLPDCAILGHSPESRAGLEQMRLLLTLLLGAAVQCPNKQIFIGRIKELDLETQHAIVELIKQVTDNQTLVLTNESLEQLEPSRMYEHIIRIARERDKFQSNWIASLASEAAAAGGGKQSVASAAGAASASASVAAAVAAMSGAVGGGASDAQHQAVELADLKSKMRRFRQELEEKSEAYMEVKEELEHTQSQFDKLRAESQKWYTESRRAAAYRDEVDVLQERAERANRLELEVQRYREKLGDAEFFKTRVEELREDNRMLSETKEMLEEQLQRARKRSDHAMQLETEIMKYKQRINDMSLDRDADKARLHELLEENTHLQLAAKQSANAGNLSLSAELATSDEECASGDNSLSEQLTNSAQTRALKLELENRRLQQSLDAAQEAHFAEHATKLLEAEKDKKRLSLKVDQLQETCNRVQQQNTELEDVFRNALEENRKLQDAIDQRRAAGEKQQLDRDVDRMKLIDTEKHVESLTKEKQRIQTLSESIQRRADDLERSLTAARTQAEQLQERADRCAVAEREVEEVRSRLLASEKDTATMHRDLSKLRETCEQKDVLLDQQAAEIASKTKDVQQLAKEVETGAATTTKLVELEARNNELLTQSAIDEQTIGALQRDLVESTLATDRVRGDLEKMGLDAAQLDGVELNVESVVQNLVRNPDTYKTIKEIVLNVGRGMGDVSEATTTSSAMCVMCHRHEHFTVERNIEISDEAGAEVSPNSSMPPNDRTPESSTPVSSTASAQSASKRVEFNVSLEPPAIALLREQLLALQTEHSTLRGTHDSLQSECARHKVDLATLGSQIGSLNTQHVALQLANTQLAAEKDALVKAADTGRTERQDMLHDQLALQCLHEQLTAEYEALSADRELLKTTLRDQRQEVRQLKEREALAAQQQDELQRQLGGARKENENLGNLRAEHSKLKEDFRNLFTTSERLKKEYKNIQAQYKVLRTENGQLRLQTGKLADELSTRTEQANGVELEWSKCAQRCEMLLQMNANLDTDRRTLMEHVSQLLAQYHELLAHSLDDKQHYHDEEKAFTDRVNNLHRQKEKLEEKIMEHYKKLESCSPKKKPFGSSFVKRVKKASSDLINKVPSRNRRSWMLDDPRLAQSEITLGSESGGNDSDNSIDESLSSASRQPHTAHPPPMSTSATSSLLMSTSLGSASGIFNSTVADGAGGPLPPMLQRNAHHRQSLQRRPHEPLATGGQAGGLMRTGVRSSYQSLRREDSIRSHRNSLHSLEPPDVTGSSLTLGTAGSRRTVYLLDENASSKLQSDANNIGCGKPKAPAVSGRSSSSPHNADIDNANISAPTASATPPSMANNSDNTSAAAASAAAAAAPSTFLMFNRISNIIGGSLQEATAPDVSGSHNGGAAERNAAAAAREKKASPPGATTSPNSTGPEDGKESAIWYEYGCI